MKICAKCIMDETAEEVTFDEKGICNFCHLWQKNQEDVTKDKQNYKKIIERIKKDGKKYDCLIGLSGGVDSSLALHYIVQEGLRPITFQIDNGWNNPIADSNVFNLVETLKVPFYRWTIDIEKFKKAQLAFIRGGIKNLEVLTDHILFASTYEMASKYKVKWIVSGGNHATEGIMPASWGEDPRDLYWIKSVYKKVTGYKLNGLPMISLWKEQYYRLIKGIKTFRILDYKDYNRMEAKKLLAEKYKWQDYGEKHCESLFTQWYQNWYLPKKWGIDKRRAFYSTLINSGQMTREEALNKISELPKKDYHISHERIYGWEQVALDVPHRTYHDYPNSEKFRKFVVKLYALWRYLQAKKISLLA